MRSLFGDSYWGENRPPGSPINLAEVPATTGILIYRIPPSADAGGHIDLWNKSNCQNDYHSSFGVSSIEIALCRIQ